MVKKESPLKKVFTNESRAELADKIFKLMQDYKIEEYDDGELVIKRRSFELDDLDVTRRSKLDVNQKLPKF